MSISFRKRPSCGFCVLLSIYTCATYRHVYDTGYRNGSFEGRCVFALFSPNFLSFAAKKERFTPSHRRRNLTTGDWLYSVKSRLAPAQWRCKNPVFASPPHSVTTEDWLCSVKLQFAPAQWRYKNPVFASPPDSHGRKIANRPGSFHNANRKTAPLRHHPCPPPRRRPALTIWAARNGALVASLQWKRRKRQKSGGKLLDDFRCLIPSTSGVSLTGADTYFHGDAS